MASINFKMNSLTITVSGVGGNMSTVTYTNLDPVDYIFKVENRSTGEFSIYRFLAGTTLESNLEGFHAGRTDESALYFLGASFPGA